MSDALWTLDLSPAFAGPPITGPAPRTGGGPPALDPRLPADAFLARGPAPSRGRPAASSSGAPPGAEPDLPQAGSIIDKYRLESLVGLGGFAAVFRATHLLLGTPVALKLLRPSVQRRRPELGPLLCEEARLAARIAHPCVVRVLDVTHTPPLTYLVLEYLEGGSLADALQREARLPLARVVRVALDVVDGLAAGLAQGIIHRDIKPANILLTARGGAKVADLGLAQPSGGRGPGGTGTPGYMAPEQAEGGAPVDFRADVYGLGVTLIHALTGQPPAGVPGTAGPAVALAGWPTPVRALLARMVARAPRDRAASYAALREELAQLQEK